MTRRELLIGLPGLPAVLAVVATLSLGWRVEASDRTGRVVGSVVVAGGIPARARLPVVKHRSICGDWKWSEELLASPGRGLANVVVTIEGAPATYRPPRAAAVLDNQECVFVPHVQVVQAGEVLEIQSGDRVIHTAHAYDEGKRTLFNVALPVYRRLVRRTLDRPGIYRIVCDVGHSWMSAYVVVVDHPYAAVTDASGGFRIPGVPPGAYRLRVWHERLGTREEPVVIRPGVETTVDLLWRAGGATATSSSQPFARPTERVRWAVSQSARDR